MRCAALAPQVGAGLAFAIAIHNVPEGICVAVPIYYSTRSKWKVGGRVLPGARSACQLGGQSHAAKGRMRTWVACAGAAQLLIHVPPSQLLHSLSRPVPALHCPPRRPSSGAPSRASLSRWAA